MGSPIIMGRKTFESLPGILPGREHFVITKNKHYDVRDERVKIFHSVEDVLTALEDGKEYFVIGGATIYKEFMPFVNSLYITHIEEDFEADTFFPLIEEGQWRADQIEEGVRDEKNKYEHTFVHYLRKQ